MSINSLFHQSLNSPFASNGEPTSSLPSIRVDFDPLAFEKHLSTVSNNLDSVNSADFEEHSLFSNYKDIGFITDFESFALLQHPIDEFKDNCSCSTFDAETSSVPSSLEF